MTETDTRRFATHATVEMQTAGAADPQSPSLERLRDQDRAAFEWVVERSQKVVMGLGQSLGLRGADLDDAAAETFLAVYQALPRFEGRSAITTWVYQIACRTLTRARMRLKKSRSFATLRLSMSDAAIAPPEADLESAESRERIWAAVASLEPRSAMAVELYYRRGLPLEEIAIALECPIGTVKTLLFRARATLRERLAALEVMP